jgi:hypothetical protein
MSTTMKRFFRKKLISQLNYLHKKFLVFEKNLQEDSIKEADFVDQSSLNQLRMTIVAIA